MATTVDQLIVEIKAETAGLRKGLDGVNKKLGMANKTAKSSMLNFGNLAKVFATIGIAKLGGQVVSTTRTFEDLNATLRAITGSAAAADASFAMIRQFTSTTTFQLENVTEGFITLFNAGIAPTAERLTNFGNVAAAFNKDITQITRAIFNATTGEMEMLKQFGIKAKQNTDSIDVTFAGATKRIDKTSDAIVEFVEEIGRVKFSTALEERAKTLSGAISNMNDSFSEFFFAIGEGGFKDVMTELALSTKAMLDETRPLARALGTNLKRAFEGLKGVLAFVAEEINKLIFVTIVFTGLNLATTMIGSAVAVVKLARSVGVLKLAMIALNKVSKKNIILLGGFMLAEATGLLDKGVEMLMPKLEKLGAAFEDFFGTDGDGSDNDSKMGKQQKELERLLDELENGTIKAKDFATILKLAEGNIAQLGLVYKGLNQQVADGNMSLDQANAKLREYLKTTGPMGEAMARIGEEIEGLGGALADDLTSALMKGENALESFKNFAFNVVQAVIAAFMELLVIQPIVDAILGAFNLSSTGRGTVRASDVNEIVTTAPRNNASGGKVQSGVPTFVGERGAEIFVPDTTGTILNGMNTKNAMGGGATVINQSINFATGVVPTVRAEVMKMMPQIADVTKGAVAEAAMRGGNYRRALQGG
tara:strand:+ start:515 stop:2464 length:1950 start_codon:yes stop_codon:yes gene_type:complete